MSTQKQFQSRALEPKENRPLRRTQEYLRELKVSIALLREVFMEVKWEKLELYFYRTIIMTVTIVHLIQFLWYSIWH
jgi:hypothetical protein